MLLSHFQADGSFPDESPQKITPCQAQWNEFLQDYNFELVHFPGKSNTIADLLSRRKDFEGRVNPNESVTLLPEHLFNIKDWGICMHTVPPNGKTRTRPLLGTQNLP